MLVSGNKTVTVYENAKLWKKALTQSINFGIISTLAGANKSYISKKGACHELKRSTGRN